MPETNVVITIHSTQAFDGADAESQDQTLRGTLQTDGESRTLTYTEGEGMAAVHTVLQAEPGKIVLTRTGSLNSKMVFREGRRHMSDYVTLYGRLPITVQTRRLLVELDDQGGRLEVEYDIEIDGQANGLNRLSLTVQPA